MKRSAAVALTLTLTLASALLAVGCVGTVGDLDGDEPVTTLELRSDSLGALKATACIAVFGEQGCSPYPNPLECDTMSVVIQRDGRACASCLARGRARREVCGSLLEGIPVVCHATRDLHCQQCVDVYGNTLHDSCNRSAQLFRSHQSGWSQLPNGSGTIVEPDDGDSKPGNNPTGNNPPGNNPPGNNPPGNNPPNNNPPGSTNPPPGSGTNKCDASMARTKYAAELNKIMASEGLQMSYAPLLHKKLLVFGGFWGFLGYGGFKGDLCKKWLDAGSLSYMTECKSSEPGKCYCQANPGSMKQSCRCSRITIAALRAACSQIPPDCDYNTWVGAYAMEYGTASAWINNASYLGGFFGNLPTPGSSKGANPPSCLGSPLVFDLGDDGVEPTRAGRVTFDLLGQGRVRTAWVGGNDALLVLDRDGNGQIDDGAELFGEATLVDGLPAPDGFRALAALDRPAAGGNGNGVLEAGDLMFGELRLWTDSDADGVSRPEELRDLPDAGIREVDLTGAATCGTVTDRHGNNLSLRGSFTRADGRRGLVVDVLFRVN